MSPQVQKLFDDAKNLTPSERVALADQLLDSVEDDEVDGEEMNDQLAYDAEWAEEIQRRVTELETGAVKAIPWEEVRQKLLRQASDADAD